MIYEPSLSATAQKELPTDDSSLDMVFSSITFLFFFLPLTMLAYALSPSRLRNVILLAVSLLFYSWGEGLYLLLMLLSISINYLCGRMLIKPGSGQPSRLVLTMGISANLMLLGYYKYANFLTENLNLLLASLQLPAISLEPVHLPIGISFFTFQAISYIVDVYRKEVEPQHNILRLSLYISLFPQLIAGPIVRYNQIAAELGERRLLPVNLAQGGERFLYGLAKKVLLANPMAAIADQIFALPAGELTTPLAWLGALCYTLQIYFDFSGYSDMAIGLGRIFGFTFPENFNYPYRAASIREFWRRWHISLSTWLRDYVYIPLGGNRGSTTRTYCNLVLVFFLCGLWHGANWTFIVWGLFHGLFLVLERGPWGRLLARAPSLIRHLLTLLLVLIGWVIFRSETMSGALSYLATMFALSAGQEGGVTTASLLNQKASLELICGLLLALPIFPWLLEKLEQFRQKPQLQSHSWASHGAAVCYLGYLLLLWYLTAISLAAGAYNPFIYFRF